MGNNAGAILGDVGGYNAGTNPDLYNFYNIYQVSADYQLTDLLRLVACHGWVVSSSKPNFSDRTVS